MKVHFFSYKLTLLFFNIVITYRYTFLPTSYKFLHTVTEIYRLFLFGASLHCFLDFLIRREVGALEASFEV